MVEIDWKAFMSVTPDEMSEQEKDSLYETVTRYTPDFNVDKEYLIHFVLVVQEILKYKAEQVDLLTNELDDLAAKQGKEEGKKLKLYLEEIERLKEELEYHKKLGKTSSTLPYYSDEDLKREMVRLEMQNEELLNELNEKEKELLSEKEEVERFAAQVANLEREKHELSRELRALQDEAAEKNLKAWKDSPEIRAEKHELSEIIHQKNQHISQLLEDMEIIEEENLSLQSKLTAVRDELSETTTHITEITAELARLKLINEDYERKITESDERNKSLNFQIEELVEEKSKHDKQLDEYIAMFNAKLQEWKYEIELKNEEILKLKEEIKKVSSPRIFTSNSTEKDLHSRIMQQEREIQILQHELSKATEEINSSTELIEKLKEKQLQLMSAPVHSQSVKFYEEKLKVLEEKLVYAEEDAHAKAEEMSSLIIQLREYESGAFGLSEAVIRIKKLETNLQERDSQIEKLVEICNNLEIKLDNFEEQNLCLREKLGLSASDEIDTSGVELRYKKEKELLESLKMQLNEKEEELIKSKLKYRKALKFLKLKPQIEEPKPELQRNSELEELSDKFQTILKENDALRKGMHEILESVRNSSGSVEVQSACLERLLEALDSRHISGWYHPAMRLQAQLSTEEGKNEELRNQIRSLRSEEKKIVSELQNAYRKIHSLEQDLSTPRYEEVETPKTPEIVLKTETTSQELRIMELESNIRQIKIELDRRKTDMERAGKAFVNEKENLLTKLAELEYQNAQLKKEKPDLAKVSEQTSQIIVLERQINFLKDLETACREENEKLKQEMIAEEEEMLKEILKLQNDKSKLLGRIEELENEILNSVSKDKFQSLSKNLANMKTKYQNAISLALLKETAPGDCLRSEIDFLQNEKEKILDELKVTKEKLIATEALVREELVTNGDFSNEISALSSKLAASEVRELNEKQKSLHLEKINEMLKTQQEEVEARNNQLLTQVTKLTEEIEKHTETERKLELKVLNRVSEEDQESLKSKMKSLQKKCEELTLERDNIQELFEISQGQCRAFQEWKDSDKILLSSTNEQILLLQSSDDDKAKISRLSHELAMTKLTTSQLMKKNNDLKIKISKLLSQNLSLELKIEDSRGEIFNTKKKHLILIEYLYETIDEIRNRYCAAVPFRHAEDIFNSKTQLKERKKEVAEKAKELKMKIHEYSVKKEEMETQLEGLENLKAGMKGDAKNLIAWHNKTTELRLKEAKCRRQNEFLVGEMQQLENCLKKLNEELTALEEGNIEKEKEWERKQILWEKAQSQLCQLLQEKGRKKKKSCDAFSNTETNLETIFDSQKLKTCEWKIKELEAEITKLRKEVQEKEEIIMMKEKLLNNINGKAKTIELEETVNAEKIENAEKEALKVTNQSLQNIIKQKEETILRYQDLLKEGREEYAKACGKLQEELRILNETLMSQTKAYNKLKNAVQEKHFASEGIPDVVEKYITKIHELEEDLRDCEMSLSSVSAKACACQQEAEKWKAVAEERILLVEEMRRRVEREQKNETQNHEEELSKYQKEIERLNQLVELLRQEPVKEDPPDKKFHETVHFQEKDLIQESSNVHVKPDQLSDCTFDKPQRQRKDELLRELDALKRQLKFSKDESARLREQIRLLQAKPQRRPKTTGSSTTRSDSKSSVKDEGLTSKIKHLEELLTMSKEREKDLMEINQKKLKSVEEVARWDEKKKNQQTIQNLMTKLKEKETEVEVLKNKNESFRNMIYKCERDKSVLESQLKSAKGEPNARIQNLLLEKEELETEVISLRNQLEEQKRHSGGLGAALLQEKLEEQERKLASFELSSKGQNALMEELERLKIANSSLEKVNLRLESENLALQLKLEKEKAEVKYLSEKVKHVQDATGEIKRQESERAIAQFQSTIEKLREENKRLKAHHKEPKGIEKVRKDLAKLRDEHDLLKEKYMEAVEKNVTMEGELKSCKYQIHLMEEKDLAEALTRTADPKLSNELIEVKAKLAHKTQLLVRVKALLVKAAAKEKALLQKVSVLQSMVSKPLHACG